MKRPTDSYTYEAYDGIKLKVSEKLLRFIGAIAAFCFILAILLSESEFYLKDKIRMFCTEDGDFTKVVAWIESYHTAEALAGGKQYVQKPAVPLSGAVIQEFGRSEDGTYHKEIVIKGEKNGNVYCILDGEVCEIIKSDQGWIVKIQHPNDLMSVYGGLNETNLEIGSYLWRDEAFATLKEEYMTFALYEKGIPIDPLGRMGVEL